MQFLTTTHESHPMTQLINQVVHIPLSFFKHDADAMKETPVLVTAHVDDANYTVASIFNQKRTLTVCSDFFTYGKPVVICAEHETLLDDEDLIAAIIDTANNTPCGTQPIADIEAFKALPRDYQIALQVSFVEPMPMFR